MSRILLHTLGSSGDFNPFMALALELRARGHTVHFAVAPKYAALARAMGFAATDAGPDPVDGSDLMRRLLAPATNGRQLVNILFKEILIPAIRPAADTLTPLAADADLFISHTIQLAARVVAKRTGTPWVSASAAALIYPTAAYPPPGVAWHNFPPALARAAWKIGSRLFEHLDAPANSEYAALGLPPVTDIVLGGVYSRLLTVGLWSPSYFPRPPDWPAWMQVGGYGAWDAPAPPDTPPLTLPIGDSPLIIFTLGSSVVADPRGFFDTAVNAIAPTNWRALLIGPPADFPIPPALRQRIAATPYARYADIFPLANAAVHSGGAGTTQACCKAGVPAIIVPRGADQFENAAHIQRSHYGLRLKPEHLSATHIRLRLQRLLTDQSIRRHVAALSSAMTAEPGASASADLVESVL